MSKAVLIIGATGTQGGALVQALIDADTDLEIIAVSRDPSSSSAQRLVSQSPKIKVIAGNLEKPDEIFQNAKQATNSAIWGVYSVQVRLSRKEKIENTNLELSIMTLNPWDESEVRQGKALVDAALANAVKMFVYSSVDRGGDASYDDPTFVPHFKTKHEIEHHLVDTTKGTEMAYTILRPVAFMNNLQPGFAGQAFVTMWNMAMSTKPLQLIAASDIGFFGAQAFLKPSEFRNKAISLAGDELTYAQFAEVFKAKTGTDIPTTYRLVAWLLLLINRDLSLMFRWFNSHGYGVDISSLREIHPGLRNFSDWLTQETSFVKR